MSTTLQDTFTLRTEIAVPHQVLADLLITFLEGPPTWCLKARLLPEDLQVTPREDRETTMEYFARNVALGGSLTLFEDIDDTGNPEETQPQRLLGAALSAALGTFLQSPHGQRKLRYGTEDLDIDWPEADSIVQLAVFGEVIYG